MDILVDRSCAPESSGKSSTEVASTRLAPLQSLADSGSLRARLLFPANSEGQWWHQETLYQSNHTQAEGVRADISRAGRFQIPSVSVPSTVPDEPDYLERVMAKAEQIGVSIIVRLDTRDEVANIPAARRWLQSGAKGIAVMSQWHDDDEVATAMLPLLALTAQFSEGAALLLSHTPENTDALLHVLAENWVHVLFHGLLDGGPWRATAFASKLDEIYSSYRRFGTTPGWYVGKTTLERTHGALTPTGAALLRLALPGMMTVGSSLDITPTLRAALRIRNEYRLATAPITLIDMDPQLDVVSLSVGRIVVVANFSNNSALLQEASGTLVVSDDAATTDPEGVWLAPGGVAWLSASDATIETLPEAI